MKNEEFINFLQESGKEKIDISPDLFYEKIDLKIASEEFKNEFLNNDFRKFDLKSSLKKEFYQICTKIFENFKKKGNFLIFKYWKISQNVDEEVLEICIKRIKIILINQKKDKKVTLYTDLIDFYCNLFLFVLKNLIVN